MGKIKFANLQIGELTIERQAFLHATNSDAHGFDLTSYDGILGMALDVGSIHDKVQQEWGTQAANHLALSPMTALFAQNTSPSLITSTFIMISAHAPGYENVANAPRLPRVSSEHWSVAMDEMLIDGQSFAFNQSRIEGVPTGRIAAALDTGSSFPALPPAAVDAIYGSVPGAVYDDISEVWLIPCDRSPNVTFVFGSDGFDIILADACLHNVYASFDYGDWNPTNNTDGTPFVQMISTTDSATMWADFHANRTATLAQLPLPLDPALIVQYEAGGSTSTADSDSATPTATSSSGPSQAADTLAKLSGAVGSTGETSSAGLGDDSWGNKYGKAVLALLAANLVVGIAVLVVTLTMCVRWRKPGRSVRASSGSRYVPVQFKEPVLLFS
ncbi:aspartic peptidase domain-containing protein [Ganoderma leucocontextum]|nr:aspartic peptidase domain-containing protein [Ganoderma leucocontextum]